MLRPLEALLKAVGRTDTSPTFYFVGDYVNRGPDSRPVVDLLLTLSNARFVRGNHDDVFDAFLHNRSYAEHPHARDAVGAFTWFIQHGLWATLTSYGHDYLDIEMATRAPVPARIAKLAEIVPETHRRFFRELPPVIEDDDLFVGHALWGVTTHDDDLAKRLSTNAERRHQMLWGRYGGELLHAKSWSRTGYFGHTPVETYDRLLGPRENVPIFAPKIVLVDTAAALSSGGRLSAVCHETQQTVQVDRLGAAV